MVWIPPSVNNLICLFDSKPHRLPLHQIECLSWYGPLPPITALPRLQKLLVIDPGEILPYPHLTELMVDGSWSCQYLPQVRTIISTTEPDYRLMSFPLLTSLRVGEMQDERINQYKIIHRFNDVYYQGKLRWRIRQSLYPKLLQNRASRYRHLHQELSEVIYSPDNIFYRGLTNNSWGAKTDRIDNGLLLLSNKVTSDDNNNCDTIRYRIQKWILLERVPFSDKFDRKIQS